jgi:hypothetical protein
MISTPILSRDRLPAWLTTYLHSPTHLIRHGRHASPWPRGERQAARHYVPLVGRELAVARLLAVTGWGCALLLLLWGDPVLAGGLMLAAAGRPGGSAAGVVHADPHPLAGQTVTLQLAGDDGRGLVRPAPSSPFTVVDYWDRARGRSWRQCEGDRTVAAYAIRAGFAGLTPDDEVVYGIDGDGSSHIVHVSELGEPVSGGAQ